MELKPGYKQTEVGVIPEDWEVKRLGEIAIIRDGTHQTPKYVPSGIPFFSVENVTSGDFTNTKFITEQEHRFLTRSFKVERGDILMTRIGSIGDCKLIDWDVDASFYVSLALLKIRKEYWAPYIAHYSKSVPFQIEIEQHSLQSAIPRKINLGPISNVRIPLPPLAEQKAIAKALSDMDSLLNGLDSLIAKKRDIKQATMQQLLTGKTRLPGFSGEWEVKRLFDLAMRKRDLFNDGDWIESEHITTAGIRLIQTGNIGIGRFIEKNDKKYISHSSFHMLRCKPLRKGDLLLCRLAEPAGRSCVLGDIGEEEVVTSVDVTIFRPAVEVVDRYFLSYVFSTPEWFSAVSDRAGGTTHKRVSRANLGNMEVSLPSLPEQQAIAKVLTDIDADLEALEQRRDKTRELKQAMMQELLTGRTRLV